MDPSTTKVRFEDRLLPLVSAGDTLGAWELLESLHGEGVRDAKEWFRSERRQIDDLDLQFAGKDHDEQFDTRNEAHWIQAWA